VLCGLAALALFVYFFRLGVPSWRGDEVLYRDAGVRQWSGDFSGNVENTPLAEYILGAAKGLFGSGPIAIRAPSAAAGLLTGVFLALLARRVGGWSAAAVVFGLWCLLPRPAIIGSVDVEQIKIDRYARLDVYMGLFVAASLFASWRWAESGRWRWAAAAGTAVGLAAASKGPGGLVLLAIVAGGIVTLGLSRRSLLQTAAVAGAALLALLAVYLPAGTEAPSLIAQMRDAQRAHVALGHPFVFDGVHYARAPWWANLWWQWKSLGTPATAAAVVCVAVAPFVLRRGLAVMLLGAILVPFAFLSFALDYSLPHYYYDWQPALIVTCGLVLVALARRAVPGRLAAVVVALGFVVAAVGTVLDVARLKPRDYSTLDRAFGPQLRRGTTVSANLLELDSNLRGGKVTGDPTAVPDLVAVIDDTSYSSRWPTPQVKRFVRAYRSELTLRQIDFLRVYFPRSPQVARRLALASATMVPGLKRSAAGRRAAMLDRCLARRGLAGQIALRSPTSATVEVRVAVADASVIVAIEPTETAAVRSATLLAALNRAGGASAVARGPIVYRGRPPAPDALPVRSCVARITSRRSA
jgi:Dolichyl-phosphate-mannose-protein mannosyltransferase